MKIGIIGFPGSGKTTIFNALTGLKAETGFSAKTKENAGVIKVPDERVDALATMSQSKKKVYAEVQFVDVAVGGEPKKPGQGLDKAFIQAMQSADALVAVVSAFTNPLSGQAPNPMGDWDNLMAELILTDLGPLENRKTRMAKEQGKDKEKALVDKCIAHLESEKPLRTLELSPEEQAQLVGFSLLSVKPLLVLINQDEDDLAGGLPADLTSKAEAEGLTIVGISAKVEEDIAGLEPEEQQEFLEALGIAETARARFIQSAYAMLDLISYLTTGVEETRAWTIRRGTAAPAAAGKIHSDIERGFIRAEVVHYDTLVGLGSEKAAKEAGKMRLEGKEYIMKDGDVVEFRFNV